MAIMTGLCVVVVVFFFQKKKSVFMQFFYLTKGEGCCLKSSILASLRTVHVRYMYMYMHVCASSLPSEAKHGRNAHHRRPHPNENYLKSNVNRCVRVVHTFCTVHTYCMSVALVLLSVHVFGFKHNNFPTFLLKL